MVSSKEIHLTSDTATHLFGNNQADVVFDLGGHINSVADTEMHVSVVKAELPVSFYNVNSSNNILRYIYETDVERTLAFNVGNYNIEQLLSHLNDLLKSQNFSNPITINWSSLSNKLTLTGGSDIVINPTSTCLSLLGFSDTTHTGTQLTSDGMIDIRGITSVYIHSDLISNTHTYSPASLDTNNCLCRIPVNAGVYGTIMYEPKYLLTCEVVKTQLRKFRIMLLDQNGNTIDFNKMKWTITLRVDYQKSELPMATALPLSNKNFISSQPMQQTLSLRTWIDNQLNMQRKIF